MLSHRPSGAREVARVAVEATALARPRTGVGRYLAELLLASRDVTDIRYTVVMPRPLAADAADVVGGAVGVRRPVTVPQRLVSKAVRGAARLRVPVPFELSAGRHDVMLYPNYRRLPSAAPSMTIVYDLSYRVVPDCVRSDYLPRLARYAEDAIANSDRVVTISEAVADEIRAAYPSAADRLVVVRPGRTSTLTDSGDGRAVSDFGLEPGFLLFVGSLEPRKNIARLIEAVERLPAHLAERHPLVLVGPDGWNNDAIHTAIARAGARVRRLDFVSDGELQRLYEHAALFVFPSRYEGFGIPVLEAMQRGCAVLCSDLPVLREVGGDAAAYVDHTDPDRLAGAITNYLDDVDARQALAAAGPARAALFDWHASAQVFADAVRELAPVSARR